MGLLTKIEDRPTPKAVYNWHVYISAATASLASFMIGYTSSFIGTSVTLTSFEHEFGFQNMTSSRVTNIKANIVSFFQVGAIFGSLLAYITAFYIGRKKSLWIFTVIFLLGAGVTLDAKNGNLGPMYAGRVISGLGVGGCTMVVPIYLAEIAPPAIRGRLVGCYELGWQIGGLLGFWINYAISQTLTSSRKQWQIPFAIQLIPAGLLLIGSLMLREPPLWLYSKGRLEEGLANLCWLRNLDPSDRYILEEVTLMEQRIDTLPKGFFDPIRTAMSDPKIQWRLFIGHMLFIFQNFGGINAINYYSPEIFESVGITGTNSSFLTTGIFGVVKTVITMLWLTVLVDKWGRRELLIYGAIAGAACMYTIGALITARELSGNTQTDGNLSSSGIATVFMIYLWTAVYTPSWNGTPWVINAEMFNQSTRNLGQVCASFANWLWVFVIARVTPLMIANMGPSGCGMYFFFGAMTSVSLVFVWFVVPETKTVPLDKMDRLFEVQPCRIARRVVMQEIQGVDAKCPTMLQKVTEKQKC